MTTISLKIDIKTPVEGKWEFNGAKSDSQQMTFEQLMQFTVDQNRSGVHELLIGDQYKPYADLDYSVEGKVSEDDFECKKIKLISDGLQAMKSMFPTGEVYIYCASSYSDNKISCHYIVNGIYFTSKAHIKHIMLKCDMKALHFDTQVYDKNKTMRMPLCTKPGQNRPLRYAQYSKKMNSMSYPTEDYESDLSGGLITFVQQDDVEMPAPVDYIESVEIVADPVGYKVPQTSWTDEEKTAAQSHLRKLISALKIERSSDRGSRAQGIWAIRKIAEKYQEVGAYCAIAHEFAKKTDQNNYDSIKVNDLYMAPVKEIGVGYKRLKEWADEDTPGWDSELGFDIIVGEEFDIELIKAKMKLVKTQQDFHSYKDAVVQYFNQFYTMIRYGRKPFIIWRSMMVNKDGVRVRYLDYKDVPSMKIDFENKTVFNPIADEKDQTFCPFKCWLKHPMRAEKNRVYFNPRESEGMQFADPHAYNLFDGLAIKREDCKDAEDLKADCPFLHHIFTRWCSSKQELYEDVLNRFALQIQKPWIKHGVALGLMSPDGSGKGIILSFLFRIIGEKYIARPGSVESILGKFNALNEAKLIIFLDEMQWGGSKEFEGALKRLITEETIGLERKGIDATMIDNPANVIEASNEDYMVASGKKGRRQQLLRLDAELAGSQTDQTAKITKSIVDTNLLSVAKFLYERDISKFNQRKIIATEALRSQKEHSLSPMDKMCLSILNRGVVKIGMREEYISNGKFPKSVFYENVGAANKYMIESVFWRNIRDLWPSLQFTRPTIDGKKTYWVNFPSIDVLRQDFRNAVDDQGWTFEEADEDDENNLDD